MTTRPRPTRAGFLRYMQEAGHDVASLDVVSLGVKFRSYVNSFDYEEDD
jgi:hypothetical protein